MTWNNHSGLSCPASDSVRHFLTIRPIPQWYHRLCILLFYFHRLNVFFHSYVYYGSASLYNSCNSKTQFSNEYMFLFHTYHMNKLNTCKTQRCDTTVSTHAKMLLFGEWFGECSVFIFRHIARINGWIVHVANETFVSNSIHFIWIHAICIRNAIWIWNAMKSIVWNYNEDSISSSRCWRSLDWAVPGMGDIPYIASIRVDSYDRHRSSKAVQRPNRERSC